MVSHNNLGFRCGYVGIPLNRKKIDHFGVHGGITFDERGNEYYWIGFDCAHWNDAPDPTLPGYERMTCIVPWPKDMGTIKTTAFVKQECFGLIDQVRGKTKTTNENEP